MPPAASSLVPLVGLSYDSGSVDGQTAASQAQANWLGDGWSTPHSYIGIDAAVGGCVVPGVDIATCLPSLAAGGGMIAEGLVGVPGMEGTTGGDDPEAGQPYYDIPNGSAGGPTAGKAITPGILGRFGIGVNAPDGSVAPLCSYCRTNTATSVDHVWPRIFGGNLEVENLTPACTFCNSSKKNRFLPLNPPKGYSGAWPPPGGRVG